MQYKCPYLCYCGMPMSNMPEENDRDEDDEKLKGMYPELYNQVIPMIKYHCNVMEYKYGKEYCPSKDWVKKVCDDIMDKCHIKDDENDENDVNDYRSPNGIWWGPRPLLEILLLSELRGRRRRRRRRRGRRRRRDHDWGDWD